MTPFISLDETTRQINETADIVEVVGEYVSLTRAGVNYKGLCPFHSEKTPSFTVNPSRNSFHCFGCNEGGDALAFIMRYHNLSFPDAVKQLAGRYHIHVPERELSPQDQKKAEKKKNIYRINEKAVDIYHEYLLHDSHAKGARLYLQSRGIPENVITEFRLGFAPESWDFLLKKLGQFSAQEVEEAGLIVPNDRGGHYDRFRNRVLCPIFSTAGKALGFGGRILDEQGSSDSAAIIHKGPKYLNSPESPVYNKSKVLFGLFQNKNAMRRSKQCLVVEGNFDLLSLVAKGITNVTAPLGTALTRNQVKAMKGYVSEVIILFDGDKAGLNAALRAVPIFLSEQLPAKVVVLPEKHDPDTFIKEVGVDGFRAYLKKAYPLPEFVFDRLLNKHGFSLAGKGAIVDDLRPIVAAIPDDQLQRSLFLSHFSQKLGLTPEQMLNGIPVSPPASVKKRTVERQETQGDYRKDLSRIEEQLLGFLVVYPEHLSQLSKAGLPYAIQSDSGKVILEKLMELALENDLAPESLIELVSGSERQFISKCLMDIEELSDSARKAEAEEKSRWLAENSRKWRMRELTKQINQAQQDNNEIRLMELLQEKNKIQEIDQRDR